MERDIIRILLVEDNPADARLVSEMLKDAASDGLFPFPYEVATVNRISSALEAIGSGGFDSVLLDLDLPDSRGLESFARVREQALQMPVVVLTGLSDETMGLKAVQEGAQDYLIKGQVDGNILARSILYAIERQKSQRSGLPRHEPGKNGAKKEAKAQERAFPGLIGISGSFNQVMGLISTVARTSRTSVLIHGETGTGKELAANSIHYLSSRKDGPFIKLNCSAIPDTLLEAEMFGYEKGAFTDAKQSKKGLFELADNGTIFLDEIGDMDIRLQPKLLQILENSTFRRVGGIKDIQVDVRVVAATNKSLEAMVREKRFREDLYYRLKVMVISLPALRERNEDIMPLAEHFLAEISQSSGIASGGFSPEVRDIFLSYMWPGNVRELKNAVERAFIIAGTGPIMPENLPHEILAGPGSHASADFFSTGDLTLDELERNYILHVLGRTKGNKTKASEILGISRLTLREKLKKARIEEV